MNITDLKMQFYHAYKQSDILFTIIVQDKFQKPKERCFSFSKKQFEKDYSNQHLPNYTFFKKMVDKTKTHYQSLGFDIVGTELGCYGFYSFSIWRKSDQKIFQVLLNMDYPLELLKPLIEMEQNFHFALNVLDYQLIQLENFRFLSTVWEGGKLIHVTSVKDKFNGNQQKMLNYIFWACDAIYMLNFKKILLTNINPRYFYELDGRDVIFPVDFSVQGELSTIQLGQQFYFSQDQKYKEQICLQNLGQSLIIILCNQQLFTDHNDMIKSYKLGNEYLYNLIQLKCSTLSKESIHIIQQLICIKISTEN